MNNPSIHVNGSYDQQDRTYDNMEVVLDEMVFSKEETKALGIETGDIVCFETRTRITEKGYIKSRFLDDKLSVAILLGYAKYLKEENVTPVPPGLPAHYRIRRGRPRRICFRSGGRDRYSFC